MKQRWTAAVAAALVLSSCAVNEQGLGQDESLNLELRGTVAGIGSSAQGVAQETWGVGFQMLTPNVTVNYSPEGSGAGREAFIGGGADFAGSDRALTLEEMEENSFGRCTEGTDPLHIPAYISPIAIVLNVEGVEGLNLDPATLAAIFTGGITRWNDPAITELNPGVSLPDLTITAVHRSDTSGTTENFTDYLAASAPEVWDAGRSGDWPYPGGEAAAQNQGVVAAVRDGVGTIGYVDASQAGQFTIAAIGAAGAFDLPTPEAAASIVENSPVEEGRASFDMAIDLDRAAEGYPIVLVSYLIVCQDYQDDAAAELVKAYASYVVSDDGQVASAQRAGSSPLSPGLRTAAESAISSIR